MKDDLRRWAAAIGGYFTLVLGGPALAGSAYKALSMTSDNMETFAPYAATWEDARENMDKSEIHLEFDVTRFDRNQDGIYETTALFRKCRLKRYDRPFAVIDKELRVAAIDLNMDGTLEAKLTGPLFKTETEMMLPPCPNEFYRYRRPEKDYV